MNILSIMVKLDFCNKVYTFSKIFDIYMCDILLIEDLFYQCELNRIAYFILTTVLLPLGKMLVKHVHLSVFSAQIIKRRHGPLRTKRSLHSKLSWHYLGLWAVEGEHMRRSWRRSHLRPQLRPEFLAHQLHPPTRAQDEGTMQTQPPPAPQDGFPYMADEVRTRVANQRRAAPALPAHTNRDTTSMDDLEPPLQKEETSPHIG